MIVRSPVWRCSVPFTAWPISGRRPFREASANQEALQGPIPQPTRSPYCLFYHDDWCFYLLLVILNYVSIIHVDTCVVVVVVVNSFRLVFVVFLMCEGMWNPYLYVLGYKFPLCILTFQSMMCCWTFRKWWLKVRTHKNTPCIVFSALNKICCILLWNLYTLLLSILSFTCIKHQKQTVIMKGSSSLCPFQL